VTIARCRHCRDSIPRPLRIGDDDAVEYCAEHFALVYGLALADPWYREAIEEMNEGIRRARAEALKGLSRA
jgi:hypothetical protein